MAYTKPEPLRGKHNLGGFSCGDDELDQWLHRHARRADHEGSARSYVTTADERVVGYYALTAGAVMPKDATERVARAQPEHRPVPIALLARLAVDLEHQGRGIGRSLLMDALLRVAGAAEVMGMRAVVVNAYDDAVSFYERFGFRPSPTDPLHLMLLMKDLRKLFSTESA